jgi:hypothetical protein
MNRIIRICIWLAVWVIGVGVVDTLIQPSTPWAMSCGVVVLLLCEAASGIDFITREKAPLAHEGPEAR